MWVGVSSIKVKNGWKLEPSSSRSSDSSRSSPTACERARAGSLKCGDGRRPRPEDGFWVPVPLVLRSEAFEGEVEWEGGCLGETFSGRLGDYMVNCMARLKATR